jgi:hypothetical protein
MEIPFLDLRSPRTIFERVYRRNFEVIESGARRWCIRLEIRAEFAAFCRTRWHRVGSGTEALWLRFGERRRSGDEVITVPSIQRRQRLSALRGAGLR